ncbi:MAG: MFS transporter, partial [bacterium]|nr:MFS transporter [bacterium]
MAPSTRRTLIQVLAAFVAVSAAAVFAVNRVAIGPMISPIRDELGMSSEEIGWVLAAFAGAQVVGCLLLGIFLCLIGARWVWPIAGVGALLAVVVGGLAKSLPGLVVFRAMLGFFAGGVYPAAIQTVADWLPSKI